MKNLIKKLTASIGVLSMAIGFMSCCYALPPETFDDYLDRYKDCVSTATYKPKYKGATKITKLELDFHGLDRENARLLFLDTLQQIVIGSFDKGANKQKHTEYNNCFEIDFISGRGNNTSNNKKMHFEYIKPDLALLFRQLSITQFGHSSRDRFNVTRGQVQHIFGISCEMRDKGQDRDQAKIDAALAVIDPLYDLPLPNRNNQAQQQW